jgi:hypothetical protein
VKNPIMTGSEVPSERKKRRDEVFPGKSQCASAEKKNADRPKPERTKPTVVARWIIQGRYDIISIDPISDLLNAPGSF